MIFKDDDIQSRKNELFNIDIELAHSKTTSSSILLNSKKCGRQFHFFKNRIILAIY